MINIRFAAAAGCALAALAAAVPAQADAASAAASGAAASRSTAQPAQAQRQRSDDERLICARIELPARRVRPRVCQTRALWENMGGVPADAR